MVRPSLVSVVDNDESVRESLPDLPRQFGFEVQAVEFLITPFGDEVLLRAIRSALDRSRTALGRQAELRALKGSYASLTPGEREVMALVVSGLLNKQVGGELGISEITVKAHRGQVMRKMNAGSRPDLVTMAAQLGVTAPRPAPTTK